MLNLNETFGVLGAIATAAGIFGAIDKVWIGPLRKNVKEMDGRMESVLREVNEMLRWKAGIEEAKTASYKERQEMKDDFDYLEEKFEKIRDLIIDKKSL